MPKDLTGKERHCLFCGRPRNEVGMLITHKEHHVCDGCLGKMSAAVAAQKSQQGQKEHTRDIRPQVILDRMGQVVIGQELAQRTIAIAVHRHQLRRKAAKDPVSIDGEVVEIEKSNLLVMGPTGSGKTLMARMVSRMLGLPFYIADATRLTQAGYVGDDVESVLQGVIADAQGDIERAEWGVVMLDEFDKIARRSGRNPTGTRDVGGEGVQQALLKLLEGSQVPVPRGMGRFNTTTDMVDTSNILFIAAGSFAGIEDIVTKRLNKTSGLGFGKELRQQFGQNDIYARVLQEDLEEFGLIPEILGRLPIVTSTYRLTVEEILRVMTESKNSVVRQMRALFELDDVALLFDAEALEEMAKQVHALPIGARGLRTVVERVTDPYALLAANQKIAAVRITVEAVRQPGTAVLTYR